jgi:hypothetical protein
MAELIIFTLMTQPILLIFCSTSTVRFSAYILSAKLMRRSAAKVVPLNCSQPPIINRCPSLLAPLVAAMSQLCWAVALLAL